MIWQLFLLPFYPSPPKIWLGNTSPCNPYCWPLFLLCVPLSLPLGSALSLPICLVRLGFIGKISLRASAWSFALCVQDTWRQRCFYWWLFLLRLPILLTLITGKACFPPEIHHTEWYWNYFYQLILNAVLPGESVFQMCWDMSKPHSSLSIQCSCTVGVIFIHLTKMTMPNKDDSFLARNVQYWTAVFKWYWATLSTTEENSEFLQERSLWQTERIFFSDSEDLASFWEALKYTN